MQEQKICPYPGLRPFTEEESIFFKGRDKHIEEIIKQTEEKKFVMLTGASGDGKSSIVYAGVIPQARAGFFKAKYNNWMICTFRPERTPLKNLAESLASNIHLDAEKTEKELTYGFSALVDLYTSSPYYVNEKSEDWQNADEKTRKQLKRKGANLFILVDQFEEFFTNPENYNNGKASVEAQTVVNLLLETAKIALAEDIPIYIICTMRSDYIGQCAAFRSLPEFIGFSQFFVPRLKRKEIYDVIEEPALLSGNSISKRLIEVLVNDLREGFDQLPVLQHALNQVWKKADFGNEEMDLIHLAKVSGMPSVYLPQKEKEKFNDWYTELMESQYANTVKKDFEKPSLENVLNAHSNELYEKAHEYYISTNPPGKQLTIEQVKFIIKKVFQCLTKIDDGRAVRNRMTLQEVTDVINDSEISATEVNNVINIFREQGNTLIYPFIIHKPDTETHEVTGNNSIFLHPDTVLDITHESLIRNWEALKDWTAEENENYQNYIDFKKQLDRWSANNKEKGYLLPIGPYTFFETWYENCNPNKYWLVKYDDSETSISEKLEKAEEILTNTRQFLKRSARKLMFSRFVLKYGANKIAATLGIICLISAITYYTFDFREKQNDYVINQIVEKGKIMLKSKKIKDGIKAQFLINMERLYPGSFKSVLDSLHNDTLAFDIAFETFYSVQNYDQKEKAGINPMVPDVVNYIDSTLQVILAKNSNMLKSKVVNDLVRLNKILSLFIFIEVNDKKETKFSTSKNKYRDILCNKILKVLHDEASVKNVSSSKAAEGISDNLPPEIAHQNGLSNQPSKLNVGILNQSIELYLALTDKQTENSIHGIDSILNSLSPFNGNAKRTLFLTLYAKDKKWKINWDKVLTHNGGYQILAYLYAAKGDYKNVTRCLDSVIVNNPEYKAYYNENFTRIINYLTKFDFFPSADAEKIVEKYKEFSKLPYCKIVENINSESGSLRIGMWIIKNSSSPFASDSYVNNLIPWVITQEKKNLIWEYYFQAIKKDTKDNDDLNFKLAIFNKKRGVYTAELFRDMRAIDNSQEYFIQAFEYFSKLSETAKSVDFTIGKTDDVSSKKIKRSVMFLYPAVIDEDNTWSPFQYYKGWTDKYFLDFIINNKQYFEFYTSKFDFEAYNKFLYYYVNSINFKEDSVETKYFSFFSDKIKTNPNASSVVNKDFFNLLDVVNLFKNKNIEKGLIAFNNLDSNKVFAPDFQVGEEPIGEVHKKLLQELATRLAINGLINESQKVLDAMIKTYEKKNTLMNIVYRLQEEGPIENTFIYMDSLFTYIDKDSKFGLKLFRVMGMIGSQFMYSVSMKMIKDVNDKVKPRALINFIRGVAYNDLYYKAYSYIPEYVASANELDLYNEILHTEISKKKKNQDKIWKEFDLNKYGDDYWQDEEKADGGGNIIIFGD